jgi:membrane-bound lytic murein transglycosylase D
MKHPHMRAWYAGAAVLGAGLLSLSFGLSSPREREAAVEQGVAITESGSVETSGAVRMTGLGPDWDLPNVDHPRVDYWIARFDSVPEMRKKFQGFLDRGGQYAPMILDRLAARGMPQDLLYLAMIESGFQPNATSPAAAVGVWQFIGETGRRYGLEIDRAVDERRDPVKATDAALDYLEMMHRRFNSWYLAAAGYNSGENRVGRLMRERFGTERARSEQDYYAIWDKLPRETRDYVPLMIAAGRIAKDPAKYGFTPMQPEPRVWEEVKAAPATPLSELARLYGTTVSAIRDLNPHLLIDRTPNNRSYAVRVPQGSLAHYAAAQGEERNLGD